jgi:hypothetical protein
VNKHFSLDTKIPKHYYMKFRLLLLTVFLPFLLKAQIFTDVSATHLPQENMNLLSKDAQSADFDGDGDLDLVVAENGQKNLLLFNQGNGVLMRDTAKLLPDADTYPFPISGERSEAVGVADFDGDGDQDILFISSTSAKNELLLNDGTGKFTYAPFPKIGTGTCVLVMDFGGDTLPDVMIGYKTTNRIYINQGSGVFQEATSTYLPNDAQSVLVTTDLKAADIDNDGDLDIIEGFDGQIGFRIYVNDNGIFNRDLTKLPNLTASFKPTSIDLGDLDNDGDLDIYMSTGGTQAGTYIDQLFLNDGTGTFTQAVGQLPIFFISTTDAKFMDLNYDGYLDIITINPYLPDSYRLLLNTPSNPGHFIPSNQLFPDFTDKNAQMLHLADFNGDGKNDVFIGNTTHVGKASGSSFDKLFLSVLGVNVEKVSNSSDIQVFPNPASHHLTIQQKDFSLKMNTIQLFDTNGRMVKNLQINGQEQHSIEVNELPNGLYILSVIFENGELENRKVLIQR